MSLKYESDFEESSDDDQSFRSSRSIIFSSGKSSSPALSRSSSMSSGISAKSVTSSESTRKSKAMLGPISRPSPTELLKTNNAERAIESDGGKVQQQNSRKSSPNAVQMNLVQQSNHKSSPNAVQMKSKKKKKESFVPIQPKIVRPMTGGGTMPQPQGWMTITTTTYSCPIYSPPVSYYPPPMMHYSPPPVQMPMSHLMPVPYSPPMPQPAPMAPPMYAHMQVQYVTLQAQYTYTTFTYIDRS